MKVTDITYRVLGLEFSMPMSVIEERIMEMSTDEFVAYAKGFFDNPFHPCAYFCEPPRFGSKEEWDAWEKGEVEGDGHKLIRRDGGVQLYWQGVWQGARLTSLVEYKRRPHFRPE